MRQLKYIEDECFFKELQALKEFKIGRHCSVYDIANLMDYIDMVDIDEVEDFLDSFELPETNYIAYTDDYIFVFNVNTISDLFTSIKKGISKMNDDNNPLKLKELQGLNEQLMEQFCETQTSNTSKSSNISINSFNLFKW